MKKIKKVLSLAIAYMMLLTVLPITAFASESSKVAEIPQYLNYGGGYCFSASLYKDEALIEEFRTEKNPNYGLNNNYGNYEYNEYITKRVLNLVNGNSKVEIKNLDGYYYVRNRTTLSKKAVYECANFNDGYLFSYDFENKESNLEVVQSTPHATFNECVEKVKEKYNLDKDCEIIYDCNNSLYDSQGNELVITQMHTINNGIRNTYVGFLFDGEVEVIETRINEDEDKWYNNYYYYSNIIFFEGNEIYVVTYDCKTDENFITSVGDNKIYKISNMPSIASLSAVIDKKVYVYDYVKQSLIIYELDKDQYKIKNTFDVTNLGGFAVDVNNNVWMIQYENNRAYVCKLENGELIKKYEVAPNMTGVKVYDDNNLLVVSVNGYTHITNKSTSDDNNGDNTTEDKNEVVIEPEVNETIDGTTKVEVGSLTEGVTNIVEATVSEETSKVEVTLTDVETIKKGEGAVTVKLDNENKINLPFKVLSEEDLDGATEVTVEFKAEENNAITDGLKAVNKVFSFELLVTKEEGQVSVHNFADGEVEVTLALSDKELEGLDRSKLVVLYYNEETKEYEEMETVVDGNNVTFKTPHFSKFIVAEKEVISDDEGTTEDETVGTETEGTTGNGSGSNGSGSNNNGATGTTTGTTNTGSTTTTTNKKPATTSNKLVATGTVASTSVLTMLGLILSGVGATLFVRRR